VRGCNVAGALCRIDRVSFKYMPRDATFQVVSRF
jgi:hypothetical protein